MNINQMAGLFGDLCATHFSSEEAVARHILRNLDGYNSTTRTLQGDVEKMVIYIQAYAKLLQDAGVKVV